MSHTKLTVNLTEKSAKAMETSAALSGDNRTNAINRAIQLYASVQKAVDDGGGVIEFYGIPSQIVTVEVSVRYE